MMNRKEAEDYVYASYLKASRFRDDRAPDSQIRNPRLTKDLIQRLSDEAGIPAIVITGSKGKGSVAVILAELLRSSFKVGLMTSPHLLSFCERFQADGCRISDEDFCRLMDRVKELLDPIEASLSPDVCISPMGIQTLLALLYFKEKGTQINIFECGKGARYDDVNQVKREYAIINRILSEHLRELGPDLKSIARDKSHVISGQERCVYIARQEDEVMEILLERADRLGVPVRCLGKDFQADQIRLDKKGTVFNFVMRHYRMTDLRIPLPGGFQAENCALALAIYLDILEQYDMIPQKAYLPGDSITEESIKNHLSVSIRERLSSVRRPGRMEILSESPFILLDACIHAESALQVRQLLAALKINQACIIIGIPDDKDFEGVARVMNPLASELILTRSRNPHYIFTDRQKERLKARGIRVRHTDCLSQALSLWAGRDQKDPLIILGTTSLVSEAEQIVSTSGDHPFHPCR